MQSPASITVTANGREFNTRSAIPLPDFLQENGIEPELVVVELNGNALTRREATHAQLHSGDRLEIVRIVAGG